MLDYFSKGEFYEELHKVLKPSVPIDSIEFLFGREKEISDIEESLYAEGRHCFIFGDRGVGKSSLAFTVANQIQSSDQEYICVNCSENSTFVSVLSLIIMQIGSKTERVSISESVKAGINFAGLGFEKTITKAEAIIDSQITDPASAAFFLKEMAEIYSERTVIVIDEFDTIGRQKDKEEFGVLVKHLSNIGCKFKLIFTGIATSLNDLMGGHLSSVRQIHQVHLEPLDWNGRFKLIDNAFGHFNVDLPDDIRFRIAGMSDGYPHYIHLICEKTLAEVYKSKSNEPHVNFDIFITSLDKSIDSIAQDIKKDYDKATEGRAEIYHHLLWAMADSADQIRKYDHIEFSYDAICKTLHLEKVSSETFKKEFSKLRTPSFGNIVERGLSNRPGWFKFKESIVRGLVRMYAEKHGITLDFQRNFTAGKISVSSKHSYRSYRPLTRVEYDVANLRGEK